MLSIICVLGFITCCITVILIVPRRTQLAVARIGKARGIFGFNIHALKREFVAKGHGLVDHGYQKLKDDCFSVQTQDMERLVVPPRYLPELRMQPDTKLSHSVALVEKHLGYYSGVDVILQDRQHSDVCRVQLTQQLPNLLPDMAAELSLSMSQFLSTCTNDSYTPIPTYSYIYAMVLAVSSRIFVGLPVARNKEWLNTVSAYLNEVVRTANVLRPWPPYIRPFLRPFLAPKSRMDAILTKASNVLGPAIEQRKGDKQNDLLGFLVETAEIMDPISIILKLLVLTSAALHTSTMAAVHTLYDLCERPEYINTLRTEVKAALAEDGGSWKISTVKKLRKLDSFMKESMRYNQPDALGFNRVVLSPIKLSNGFILPVGTFINMAAESMSRDAAYYENPNTFDVYRFSGSSGTNENNPLSEFTGIEPGNLAWGNGRLTCPGRWYASALNKLIIGSLLADYEMKFPDGQVKRPENIYSNGGIMPNPIQEILLKKGE